MEEGGAWEEEWQGWREKQERGMGEMGRGRRRGRGGGVAGEEVWQGRR